MVPLETANGACGTAPGGGGIRSRRNLERQNFKSVPNCAAVFEGPKPFF